MRTLRDIIKEELIEIRTKKKRKLASGREHVIYRNINRPDRLFKIGDKNTIMEWVDLFKENPELFPKIYKVGKMKGGDDLYVEIEKLNTKKYEEEYEYLSKIVQKTGVVRYFESLYITYGIKHEVLDALAKYLQHVDPKAYLIFSKIFDFLSKLDPVAKKHFGDDFKIDFFEGNFGYDDKGNLKCLDI